MIKIENIDVYGFETAIRGMRNPMNSWNRSDSEFERDCEICETPHNCASRHGFLNAEGCVFVGKNDLDLMQRLFKGGTEHRKYLRFINITMDITAPLYWWKEFDTYKVGTVANSCSTMHKIHSKEFTLDDFSWEQLMNTDCDLFSYESHKGLFQHTVQPVGLLKDFIIPSLNVCRNRYLETKDKADWWQMIQLLPSSYNQRRTVQMNYEVAVRIIEQRKGHKLDEWHDMVKVLLDLPYMKEIMMVE